MFAWMCMQKDEKQTRYNVEMQVERKPALGKEKPLLSESDGHGDVADRRRLYGTSEYLCIFICDFDPFGKDKYRYTFRTTCQESENVDLEDGRTTVF